MGQSKVNLRNVTVATIAADDDDDDDDVSCWLSGAQWSSHERERATRALVMMPFRFELRSVALYLEVSLFISHTHSRKWLPQMMLLN